jgi:hypothetical protein
MAATAVVASSRHVSSSLTKVFATVAAVVSWLRVHAYSDQAMERANSEKEIAS